MKRFLCALLALLLCVGLMPAAAMAADEAPSATEPEITTASATDEPDTSATDEPLVTQAPSETGEPTTAGMLDGDTEGDDEKGTPANPRTIQLNTSMTAVQSEYFTITLANSGLFYLESEQVCLGLVPEQGYIQIQYEPGGGVIRLEAGTYTFETNAAGSFTLYEASQMTFSALSVGKNEVAANAKSVVQTFTASSAGTYVFTPINASEASVCTNGYYGDDLVSYTLELQQGETVWVSMRTSAGGSLLIANQSDVKELALETAATVTAGELYKVTVPSGWYVLDTNGVEVVCTGSNGSACSGLTLSAKKAPLFMPINSRECFIAVGGNGSIQLRAAEADDFTSMTENTEYTTTGAYCFTAPSDGSYKITRFMASVYDANGQELNVGWANYRSMTAGESLYVAIEDYAFVIRKSFKIEKKDIPTIELGQTVSVERGDAIRYSYTAPETGIYCCFVESDCERDTYLYSQNYEDMMRGWYPTYYNGSQQGGYRFLSLTKDQQVYLDMYVEGSHSETGKAAMTFNSLSGAFQSLTLNTKFTATKAQEGAFFTPNEGGLYIISGDVRMYEDGSKRGTIDGMTACAMEAGTTYLFIAEQAGGSVIVQTPEQYGAVAIGLNEEKTEEKLYRFTAPDDGLYKIVYENGLGESFYRDGNATDGGTLSLAKDEIVYLFLRANGESEPKLTVKSADLSELTPLSPDTEYDISTLTESQYVFHAEEAGTYVMTLGGQTTMPRAEVLVENSGLKAPEGIDSIFALGAKQRALISIYGNNEPEDPMGGQQPTRTLKITKLSDATVRDVTGEETELAAGNVIYRFTAPADGEYKFSLSELNGRYIYYAYFYDQNMRQSLMFFNNTDNTAGYKNERITCQLSKGDVIYLATETRAAASGEMSSYVTKLHIDGLPETDPEPTAKDVVSKLEEIEENATETEVRETVQEIGAQALQNALVSEEAETVLEKIDELEKNMEGSVSVVVTDDAKEAGVSKNVGVIGVKLNDLAANSGNDITLTIDVAEAKALPEGIAAENAIHLSIELEGVDNPHELKVPVCLTVAVPEGMKPENVCLVHFAENSEGKVAKTEILRPTVYQEKGTWYARFVIGGFSHFVLAEAVTVAETPAPTATPAPTTAATTAVETEAPKTGDESHVAVWAAVLLAACGAAVVAVARRKKENERT